MRTVLSSAVLTVLFGSYPLFAEGPTEEEAIPAFARLYRTSCSTCHTAAPKLNVLGEVFRLNGYQLPDNDLLLRYDEPVPLGDEMWKEEWPRAIWPGEIPGQVPLALRIVSDLQFTRSDETEAESSFRFPNEIYILAGTPLAKGVGAFIESEWSRDEGLEVIQAKAKFQDLIPGLPSGALNIWVGLQNLYLFTFTDRQIDRAGRQKFAWQEFRAADFPLTRANDLEPTDFEDAGVLVSDNEFRLGWVQPSIEFNGLLTDRLYYGLGVAQGAVDASDSNDRKDVYYKLRYKLGGLDLRGRYDLGAGPVAGTGGQLLDRSLIVEHFGYFGAEPTVDGSNDEHHSLGISARGLYGPWDIGVGYVRRKNEAPWGRDVLRDLEFSSVFGKIEFLGFPWLLGSLKVDWFEANVSTNEVTDSLSPESIEQTRVLPGIIALIRQNIRAVVEGEVFLQDTRTRELSLDRPHALWMRLDLAF